MVDAEKVSALTRLRYETLEFLYERSGGSERTYIPFSEVVTKTGKSPGETHDIIKYLAGEGLARFAGNNVKITHAGIREIEEAHKTPASPTEHFPPVNIMIGNVIHDSQIEQGKHQSVAAPRHRGLPENRILILLGALASVVTVLAYFGIAPHVQPPVAPASSTPTIADFQVASSSCTVSTEPSMDWSISLTIKNGASATMLNIEYIRDNTTVEGVKSYSLSPGQTYLARETFRVLDCDPHGWTYRISA